MAKKPKDRPMPRAAKLGAAAAYSLVISAAVTSMLEMGFSPKIIRYELRTIVAEAIKDTGI